MGNQSALAIKWYSKNKFRTNDDHYNFSRTWICHSSSLRSIFAQFMANDENRRQTEGTWNYVPTNVFRQTSSLQLLPTPHQNTLEFTPFYLALVILGGLRHPTFAAGAGGIYLVARIIYSLGYYTGNPKSRIPGFILNLLALTALLGYSVSTAAGLLGWW